AVGAALHQAAAADPAEDGGLHAPATSLAAEGGRELELLERLGAGADDPGELLAKLGGVDRDRLVLEDLDGSTARAGDVQPDGLAERGDQEDERHHGGDEEEAGLQIAEVLFAVESGGLAVDADLKLVVARPRMAPLEPFLGV